MTQSSESPTRDFSVSPWELGGLLFQVLALGVGVLVLLLGLGPKLVDHSSVIPLEVWAGCAFFALFWVNVPLLSIFSRSRLGHGLPLGRALILSVCGAIIGGLLFRLLL